MTYKKYLIVVGVVGSMHNSLLIDNSVLMLLDSESALEISGLWTPTSSGHVKVYNGNWWCDASTQNDAFEVKIYGFN